MILPFKNEAIVDFTNEKNRLAMEEALRAVEAGFGREYPLYVNGKDVVTERKFNSLNPSNHSEVVAVFSKAGQAEAQAAVEAADAAFPAWAALTFEERARYLFKAAAIMRKRRFELDATMVLEAGKSWIEADADTAEAIDFLDFYAHQAFKLANPCELVHIPNEDNQQYYIPLGVGLIIPPWNFPLAILVGMTSAALVTGNTVVLKPASTTPLIGWKFVEIMRELHLPAGVLNFVPGSGAEVGDFLVTHKRTRFISFTGSMEVGMRINELANKYNPDCIWIKRVVAEMGGKDAIVVDETADVEWAATGIVASAFGFSGQKCSACSRVIAHEKVYDKLLALCVEKTKKITVGETKYQANFMGPVNSKEAYEKILSYIEIGKTEGRVAFGGEKGPETGYFINPTIIADLAPGSRVMQEEIFGPVVGFTKVKSFDEAMKVANGTKYGLTGSVYANDRSLLERARREFMVGNLYFNRKCTGALVGVHPFGGFNMSGTDSKAGGFDYLLLFVQTKSVSESLAW